MSEPRNLLDDLFSQDEREVETFVDVIKALDLVIDPDVVSQLASDRPEKIAIPEFADQTSGGVRINHGWHDQEYVWHISPAQMRRPWKVSTERVIRTIMVIMNPIIPNHIVVKVWPPKAEWEIPEVTFKAYELKGEWCITDRAIENLNIELFKTLNELI
jgi:hypothetical protein